MLQFVRSGRLWRRVAVAIGLAAALAAPASAQVFWSSLSLNFTEPSGVVGPNDDIEVWVRFSNNDPSEDFVFDSKQPLWGLNAAEVPSVGSGVDEQGNWFQADFASYTHMSLGLWFGCSGSFTTSCTDGPPYSFSFAATPFSEPYVLAAGASSEMLFGTFMPSGGPVAPGDYYFYRSLVGLMVLGQDAAGRDLTSVVWPASTCNADSLAGCLGQSYFTRTVVAVPEPQTDALMLVGLGLGLLVWRRGQRCRSA